MEQINLEVIEKGYKINFNGIDEGYLAGEEKYCSALSKGKAKSILWERVKYDGWRLFNGEEVTFLNLPVIRDKEGDKYEFEGSLKTLHQVTCIQAERLRNERLDDILKDENIKFAYIKKGGYYRPNHCGYTDNRVRAGVYTKQDAVKEARHCKQVDIVVIDINEHNSLILKEIESLNSRILQ